MSTKQNVTGKRKGSGKQVLNHILNELSTRLTPESKLSEATDRLRAGLLLHGSTSDETYESVGRLAWASSKDDDGDINRQGIVIANGNVFISDLFESIIEVPELKHEIMKQYPNLTPDDYEAGIFAIWLVLSSVQTFTNLLPIEIDKSRIDANMWVESMMKHYRNHFS
jgi:hypothetical protein